MAKGGMSNDAVGNSGMLSLIVDVVRLTLEVMDKFSQKKNDDSKKD